MSRKVCGRCLAAEDYSELSCLGKCCLRGAPRRPKTHKSVLFPVLYHHQVLPSCAQDFQVPGDLVASFCPRPGEPTPKLSKMPFIKPQTHNTCMI